MSALSAEEALVTQRLPQSGVRRFVALVPHRDFLPVLKKKRLEQRAARSFPLVILLDEVPHPLPYPELRSRAAKLRTASLPLDGKISSDGLDLGRNAAIANMAIRRLTTEGSAFFEWKIGRLFWLPKKAK
jgi:hypothetical protein